MAGARGLVGVVVVAAVAAGGGIGAASALGAPGDLSEKAAAQIAAMQDIKRSQSNAEQKLDSRLVVELRRRRDRQATAAAPQLNTGVEVSKADTAEVDVRVRRVSGDLLSQLEQAGAQVRHVSKETGSIRAALPLGSLERVASFAGVLKVQLAAGAITARMTGQSGMPRPVESKQAKQERLEAQIGEALAQVQQGAIVSEGDKTHAADAARARHRVTGVGVKICALSDGVDSLAASQAAGELPPDVDVLPGMGGGPGEDEGTAMLELIHDLAPNAKLGFATAFISDASFAQNIRDLRFEAGCDIIVDDILYFNESPFQDGPIAQSVNAVTADGALFFSSAGNEGNTLDGTSGNYEFDFIDSGRQAGKFVGQAHDFDPGPGVQIFEPISPQSSGNVPVTLFWADALGQSNNDYDLYLFDANEDLINLSQDVQNGDDDPYEILGTPLFGGSTLRLAVVKYRGDARYFQLSALRSRFKNSADGLVARVTPGVTRGHSAAADAFSTAAAPAFTPLPFALEPGDPPNPSGPFPNPFTAAQLPERFTSDGPRRVFYRADGTPITPGNYGSTGGEIRQKPNITAADGTITSVDGFERFFGTSAAAPHAAAIAGLVLSGNPGAGLAEVRGAFGATALDLTPAGVDGRTGQGIIRADRVLNYTGATPQPLVEAQDPTVTPATGDGDAFLEPGERATVTLPLKNVGDGTATGVNAVVTDDDPQTTINPRTRSYGNIAAGASKSRDFTLTLANNYPVGKPVLLSVRVQFAGVLSPTSRTLRVAVGEPSSETTRFSYTGPAVPIPDNSTVGGSVTIPVTGVGYASKLVFSIDGETCNTTIGSTTVGIDHTWVSDLAATLTGPGGQIATLWDGGGGNGNNICQAVLDDAATAAFSSRPASAQPFTGTWKPDTPLADFLHAPVDGDWTLKVVDTAAADTGNIRAVSLGINGFVE